MIMELYTSKNNLRKLKYAKSWKQTKKVEILTCAVPFYHFKHRWVNYANGVLSKITGSDSVFHWYIWNEEREQYVTVFNGGIAFTRMHASKKTQLRSLLKLCHMQMRARSHCRRPRSETNAKQTIWTEGGLTDVEHNTFLWTIFSDWETLTELKRWDRFKLNFNLKHFYDILEVCAHLSEGLDSH